MIMNINIYANYIHMLVNEYMITLKQIIFWDEWSNNYDFFNKMSRSNLGLKSQVNYKLKRREY
jgi:hypothetical protein